MRPDPDTLRRRVSGSARPVDLANPMIERVSTVVLVVRGPTSPRRERELCRFLRALVPAAVVLVSPVPLDLGAAAHVATVTVEEIDAGPLAVAAALARRRGARA